MIVDSMTIQEICKAILSEKEYVCRVFGYRKREFEKVALKSRSFPCIRTYSTRTPEKKTEFKLRLICNGKKGPNNFNVITFAKYVKPEGIYVVMIENDWSHVTIFTPHFFQRYQERKLKDSSLSYSEIIDLFFMDFYGYVDMWVDENDKQVFELSGNEEDNKVNMIGVFHDGLILGFNEGKVSMAKTFVPYEMLHEDQIKRYEWMIDEFNSYMRRTFGNSYLPSHCKQ